MLLCDSCCLHQISSSLNWSKQFSIFLIEPANVCRVSDKNASPTDASVHRTDDEFWDSIGMFNLPSGFWPMPVNQRSAPAFGQ
jgi:hypothetical protein